MVGQRNEPADYSVRIFSLIAAFDSWSGQMRLCVECADSGTGAAFGCYWHNNLVRDWFKIKVAVVNSRQSELENTTNWGLT